ncbi:tyrosine-protein phosphatase non-receptor type 4-like [Convolutriloba macropyga]|uniref:tyrosine-protein phosphatase non-receptor type 4-like n=1 Tax=Convolutriloba macropyga TaxID=536237 RepID=UPI003F51DB83
MSVAPALVNCTIQFYHSNDTTQVDVPRVAKGSELYEQVTRVLLINGEFPKHLFGLEFADNVVEHRKWLDLNKQLKLQIPPHVTAVKFNFKIKFFELEPHKKIEGFTQRLYIAQLVAMLKEGSLKPQLTANSNNDSVSQIGAYMLFIFSGRYAQIEADHGTYSKYLKTSLPNDLIVRHPMIIQKAVEIYKNLTKTLNERPGAAKKSLDEIAKDAFLEAVSKIDRYGFQFYQGTQAPGATPIEIGVSMEKISIFQRDKIVRNLRWQEILKLAFKNELFTIEVFDEELSQQNSEQETLTFSFNHYRTAKEFWHTCVDHHSMYRSAQGASPVGTPPLDRDKQLPKRQSESTTHHTLGRSSTDQMPNGQPPSTSNFSNKGTTSTMGATIEEPSAATDSKSSQDMHVATLAYLDPNFSVNPPHFRRRNLTVAPNDRGKFGFSFEGGDGKRVNVTKIDPAGAARNCNPPLNEGDEILEIFGKTAQKMSAADITNQIRETGARMQSLQLTVLTQVPDESTCSSPLETSINEMRDQLHLQSDLANAFHNLEKKKPSGTFKIAEKNYGKNRYNDVWPYDDTRVALNSECDYINASYVKVQNPDGSVLKYIAAQGPLDQTVEDFWRMIYEKKISHVIMVTALKERDIKKCVKYWPDINCPTPTAGNEFLIDCTSEQQNDDGFTTRNLTLRKTREATVRDVVQCQYHDWPDHGVPQGTDNFLKFIQRIREFRTGNPNENILVHCSAGIGRTGVVILTEASFKRIDMNEPLPLIQILKEMRSQRPQLIQNFAQFSYVCRAILAYFEVRQRRTTGNSLKSNQNSNSKS